MTFDTSSERSHAPNTMTTEKDKAPCATATELIAHLESGGLIARGDPRHAEFLRFEIYGENRVKHLGSYGWGSALGRVENRLMDVLREPHTWVCIPTDTPHEKYETVAAALLSETGEYENYDWRLTLWDNREANTPTPQPNLLATRLKEAREEAFRDAIMIVRGSLHAHSSEDMQEACAHDFAVNEVLANLEAAARGEES